MEEKRVIAPGALGKGEKIVPLVMYENDIRIVIGEATVDLETMTGKAKIDGCNQELQEIVGTVFKFGPDE